MATNVFMNMVRSTVHLSSSTDSLCFSSVLIHLSLCIIRIYYISVLLQALCSQLLFFGTSLVFSGVEELISVLEYLHQFVILCVSERGLNTFPFQL